MLLKRKLVVFVQVIAAYSLGSCAQSIPPPPGEGPGPGPKLEQHDVGGPEYNTPPPRHR